MQKDWVLLQRLADFHLDGWSAVRLDTVAEVRGTGNGKAVGRALKLHDEHPSAILVDLSSTGEIIRTMARWSPLVTVHREAQYPDSCWIGRPLRVTDKVVELLQVDSRAEWDDDPDRFKLRDLTQIEIGGRYEQALHELAGEPPVA